MPEGRDTKTEPVVGVGMGHSPEGGHGGSFLHFFNSIFVKDLHCEFCGITILPYYCPNYILDNTILKFFGISMFKLILLTYHLIKA